MAYEFGSGSLWAIPTITLAGVAVTNPTPVPFGALQDVTVDMSWTMKELFGQYQFPLAVARGTAKLTAKAKAAKITATLFNQVFGESVTTPAENKVAFQEAGTVPAASVYIVTVTNNATWTTDLGVIYSATGLPLTRGATATGIGVYSVAAGVYTFNSADANAVLKISYIYTTTVAPGTKFTINNQLLGLSPFFSMTLNQVYQGKQLTMTFNRCVASKLALATKLEDFNIPELDISMMADDANIVGTCSVYEY
jgi:hypothetical protein